MKNPEDYTLEDILARKTAGRRKLAQLSFGEKVKIVEEMRGQLAPFHAIRAARKQVSNSNSATAVEVKVVSDATANDR